MVELLSRPLSYQVYPVGIPVLYAVILWKNRELLNPRIHVEPDSAGEAAMESDPAPATGDEIPSATLATASKGVTKKIYTFEELQELEEKVEARKVNPELVPSMFLWKDFGESFDGDPVHETWHFQVGGLLYVENDFKKMEWL